MPVTITSGVTDLSITGGVGSSATLSIVASGNHASDQGPTAVDTAHQVLFGPGGTITGEMTINADGSMVCNVDGDYFFSMNLTYGRSTNSGLAKMHIRVMINGVQRGASGDNFFSSQNDRLSKGNSFVLGLTAGDILHIELVRDSTGANDGGLFISNPAAAGWADSPSANIAIYKVG